VKKKSLFANLVKYREYILYYSRILLKQRVAGSYLGFLWLFLDPLMFMLVYSFVVKFLFNSPIANFNLYVFIGLTTWKLVSGTLLMSPTTIVRNKGVFQQVYFHKFVYPTIYLMVNIYEFLIANTLIIGLMLLAPTPIPFTWHMLEFFPITFVAVLFTWGCSLIISHFGVYFFDLRNILDFTLKFLFYLSPIMWSYGNVQKLEKVLFTIANIPIKVVDILKLNPASIIIESFRAVLFEGKSPDYFILFLLALISCGLIFIGYRMMSRHEDSYARII